MRPPAKRSIFFRHFACRRSKNVAPIAWSSIHSDANSWRCSAECAAHSDSVAYFDLPRMYSIFATLVASIFLGYGAYALAGQGRHRSAFSFFSVCVAAALWQSSLGVLAQFSGTSSLLSVLKFGYVMTLFLPSCLFHFLSDIADQSDEKKFVYLSYAVSIVLAILAITTNQFVPGYYDYSWGYYAKAGPLHPLHAIQAVTVLSRGIYLCYLHQRNTTRRRRAMFRTCMAGAFTFSFAALDDLCRYGVDIYPPGAGFVLLSLGAISVAIVKYKLLNPRAIAASVAHEMRTPLRAIRNRVSGMHVHLPALLSGYQLAVEHGLCDDSIRPPTLRRLASIGEMIEQEVDRTNTALDMMLANINMDRIDRTMFSYFSIVECIDEALERYPFERDERARVKRGQVEDFQFFGSSALLTMVLFNLIKNALYATAGERDASIVISTLHTEHDNRLLMTDTGVGVAHELLAKIFDPFFTTKKADGSGVGLAFCERVLTSFGGRIFCESEVGGGADFTLQFPHCK